MTFKILIVEDDHNIIELLTYNLEQEGFDVHTAPDGADGLQRAASDAPDLIILDLLLPEIDGLEVCRLLKRNPRTAAIPVIMLTAKGEEVDRIVGFELGADDYIAKPFLAHEKLYCGCVQCYAVLPLEPANLQISLKSTV